MMWRTSTIKPSSTEPDQDRSTTVRVRGHKWKVRFEGGKQSPEAGKKGHQGWYVHGEGSGAAEESQTEAGQGRPKQRRRVSFRRWPVSETVSEELRREYQAVLVSEPNCCRFGCSIMGLYCTRVRKDRQVWDLTWCEANERMKTEHREHTSHTQISVKQAIVEKVEKPVHNSLSPLVLVTVPVTTQLRKTCKSMHEKSERVIQSKYNTSNMQSFKTCIRQTQACSHSRHTSVVQSF